MKTQVILTEHEKRRNRLIKLINKSVEELQRMNYKIYASEVETLTGQNKTHIYLCDKLGERIIFQKYLLSLTI